MNLFRCLINPFDKFPLVEVLSYLEKHDEVYDCANKNIYDLLLNDKNNYNPNVTEQLPIYELAEYFIKLFDLKHELYLQTFLDEILTFTSKDNDNLPKFISHWDTNRNDRAAILVSDDTDAIQILTIHKSKGLEFRVVINPFCDWDINLKHEKTWEEIEGIPFEIEASNSTRIKEIEQKVRFDNINLMYVCFTRAVERLYVLSTTTSKTKEISNTNKLISHFLNGQSVYEHGNPCDSGKCR